ncbi:hypothetical protein [Novosphingobium subterraneum]|jgi:hypothetical protein|uniref:hypothetical protein n=1 Tax=Novosphingobium subterraneum TaxID=48936 RepID=UPI00078795BE|nr:hypothetical protein [Novosphingobium subterraneum]
MTGLKGERSYYEILELIEFLESPIREKAARNAAIKLSNDDFGIVAVQRVKWHALARPECNAGFAQTICNADERFSAAPDIGHDLVRRGPRACHSDVPAPHRHQVIEIRRGVF